MSEKKRSMTDLRVIDLRVELEKRKLDKTGVRAVLLKRLSQFLKSEGEDPETYTFEPLPAESKTPSKRSRNESSLDADAEDALLEDVRVEDMIVKDDVGDEDDLDDEKPMEEDNQAPEKSKQTDDVKDEPMENTAAKEQPETAAGRKREIKDETEAKKPCVEAMKPSVEAKKPSVEAKKPSVEAKKPSVEIKKPSVETKKPSIESKKPSVETKKPSVETKKSGVEAETAPVSSVPVVLPAAATFVASAEAPSTTPTAAPIANPDKEKVKTEEEVKDLNNTDAEDSINLDIGEDELLNDDVIKTIWVRTKYLGHLQLLKCLKGDINNYKKNVVKILLYLYLKYYLLYILQYTM